jgi:hypothetical protein
MSEAVKITIDDLTAAAAELRRLHAELERKSDAIQRLWKERDELRALNAELVKALRGTFQEMLSVLASLNAEQMPHDGDEFHERLEKARAALAKVEASK